MAASSSFLISRNTRGQDSPIPPPVEEFFRLLGFRLRSRLVNRCGANFSVALAEVRSTTLEEVRTNEALVAVGVYVLLRVDKARLPGLVVMHRGLMVKVIGAMLGDDKPDKPEGEDEEGSGEFRSLSPVEAKISARFTRDLCADARILWPGGSPPPIDIDGTPGPARVIHVDAAENRLITGRFEVSTDEGPFGEIEVGFPETLLRPGGTVRPVAAPKKKTVDINRVLPVEVDAIAEMARLTMRVRDLKSLEVGDLIPLGRLDAATLRINGKAVFSGEPGHQGGQRCLRVKRRVGPS